MFVVDTNVLLYAVNEDAPEQERCKLAVRRWCEQPTPWYLTWGVVYEFLRVATHPRVFRRPLSLEQAWSFLNVVLTSQSVDLLSETKLHRTVSSEVFSELPDLRGNRLFDARTAILMREHGISTIYTRDTDFNRFPFLTVIDPVSETTRRS